MNYLAPYGYSSKLITSGENKNPRSPAPINLCVYYNSIIIDNLLSIEHDFLTDKASLPSWFCTSSPSRYRRGFISPISTINLLPNMFSPIYNSKMGLSSNLKLHPEILMLIIVAFCYNRSVKTNSHQSLFPL